MNQTQYPPASSSRHFSCSLPFLGTANNNLSCRLSTSNDIVDSAPNEDFDALSLLPGMVSELGVCGNGGRRGVEYEAAFTSTARWPSPMPLDIAVDGWDMGNVQRCDGAK